MISRSRPAPADLLEHEFLQERASALGRLGRALETALTALARFDAAPPAEGQKAELTFWKLNSEAKKLTTHKTDLADVRCLAFSPEGGTLAVGGYTDGVVQLWALVPEPRIEKKDKKPDEKK